MRVIVSGAGETQVTLRMLELSAVFMVVTFAVFALYGVFAAAVRLALTDR